MQSSWTIVGRQDGWFGLKQEHTVNGATPSFCLLYRADRLLTARPPRYRAAVNDQETVSAGRARRIGNG